MPADFNLLLAERDAADRLTPKERFEKLAVALPRIGHYERLGVVFTAGPGRKLIPDSPKGVIVALEDRQLWAGLHDPILTILEKRDADRASRGEVEQGFARELARLRKEFERAGQAIDAVAAVTGQTPRPDVPFPERIAETARGAARHALAKREERTPSVDARFTEAWGLVKTLQGQGISFYRTDSGALGYRPEGSISPEMYKRFAGQHALILRMLDHEHQLEQERRAAVEARAAAQRAEQTRAAVQARATRLAAERDERSQETASLHALLVRISHSAEHAGPFDALPDTVRRRVTEAARLRQALGGAGSTEAPEILVRRSVAQAVVQRQSSVAKTVMEMAKQVGVVGDAGQLVQAPEQCILGAVETLCHKWSNADAALRSAQAERDAAVGRARVWQERFSILKGAVGGVIHRLLELVPGLKPLVRWWNDTVTAIETGGAKPPQPDFRFRGDLTVLDAVRANSDALNLARRDSPHTRAGVAGAALFPDRVAGSEVTDEDLWDPDISRARTITYGPNSVRAQSSPMESSDTRER